jgi:ferric-dicitrate binding protein FerR (iron transport regulator)
VLAILAAASLAPAQRVVSAKSGLVYFTIGRVWVDQSQLNSGEIVRQLQTSEILHTARGRAEVLLNPGTVLRLGNNGRLRMDSLALTDANLSLLAGSAVITVMNAPKLDRVKLRIGSGTVILERDGVYRLDSSANLTRLRVFSGRAQVLRDGASTPVVVRRGTSIEMDDLQLAKFDTKDTDALDRWAKARTPVPRGPRPVPPRPSQAGVPPPQPKTSIEASRRTLGLDASGNPILPNASEPFGGDQ